jgi:glycosyltransferase involved in cell wall biosynthesis
MPRSKAYDIVFNATFDDMPRKRHNTMLDLLQDPLLQHKTALFLGRGKPENVQRFTRAIERQGLSRRAKVLANIPRQDVPAQLSRCRMGVHLALHENVCRSIYEYFRSDLPCVMSSATGGMNPAIVNAQTGLIATDADLPAAIYRVLNQPHRFSPRRWFLEQSGASISSERLNRRFKQIFSDLGYTWREDIVELSSSGANRYVHQADYQKFKPEFAQLLACFRQNPGLPIRLALD